MKNKTKQKYLRVLEFKSQALVMSWDKRKPWSEEGQLSDPTPSLWPFQKALASRGPHTQKLAQST